MLQTDVELSVDVRDMQVDYVTPESIGDLWTALEPAIHGRRLTPESRHKIGTEKGAIILEVLRTAPGGVVAGPNTKFSIVGVHERPSVRYKCASCLPQDKHYGPFICKACKDEGRPDRLCDIHVDILDGALVSTCERHHPTCADEGCTNPATFRCGGPRCAMARVPHCDAHRRPHPAERGLDHCRTCYAIVFPQCEVAGCSRIGTVRCEFVHDTGRACGTTTCPRHVRRWQVYGPERKGLGRCTVHSGRAGLTEREVLRQIVLGSLARKPPERLPRIAGFQHSLRSANHGTVAPHRVLELLDSIAVDAPVARSTVFARSRSGWKEEVGGAVEKNREGQQLTDRLRLLAQSRFIRDGAAIAAAIQFVEYKTPRQGAPVLYVDLPDQFRGLFKGKQGATINALGAQLGVDLRLEGRGR